MKQSKSYRTIERNDKKTKRQNNDKLEDGAVMLNFDHYIWQNSTELKVVMAKYLGKNSPTLCAVQYDDITGLVENNIPIFTKFFQNCGNFQYNIS